MRTYNALAAGLALSVGLWSAGFAATAPAPQSPPAKTAPAADCEKTGSAVSALIDASAGSPNLPAARAAFQVGIMNCMEGQDEEANKHYSDAQKLLNPDRPKVPVNLPKT